MPTYSYACTECDNRFDIAQSFTDDALTVCAECSGRLRKLFNSVGVVFKGSGFYRTDSRNSSAGSEKAKPAESKSSDTKKSDSSTSTSSAPAPAKAPAS